MKNRILISVGMLMLLVTHTCFTVKASDNNNYTINGRIQNKDFEGKTVYFQKIAENWKNQITTDRTVVKDGAFHFKGSAEATPAIGFVVILEPEHIAAILAVEAGEIELMFDSAFTLLKGSPLNDKQQALETLSANLLNELNVLNQKLGSSDDPLAKSEIENKITEKIELWDKELLKYIQTNIKNEIGIYYFVREYANYKPQQAKALLEEIPAAYKENVMTKAIEKQINALVATDTGNKFIDLQGSTPEGNTIALSDYAGKGKYVLIDFWSSWCGPCIAEMPVLVEAYDKYKDKGFEIVGVSMDTDKSAWTNAIKRLNLEWIQLSDLLGWQSELPASYGVNLIPHTVLLDKNGVIIQRNLRWKELISTLEELF